MERARMQPFANLTSFSDALSVAREICTLVRRSESVALAAAAGRVLAADAIARIDVPGDDRAAMDGYVVRAAEAVPGASLLRAGRIAAGQPADRPVRAGCCIEIATGSSIPDGADAVVPVEQTDRDGDRVSFTGRAKIGDHIARRGVDLQRNGRVGAAGDVLHPALLSACAAAGIFEVQVTARPRVLVAPTGDEVVALGEPLGPGQVYDSNATGLVALLQRAGADVERAGIVVDDTEALAALLARPDSDLTVTIGGTSVGRRDLVPDAAAAAGEVLIHGVALRPGKPLLLARAYDRPFIGLPGFPTTCMMLGYALLQPLARRMAGLPEAAPRTPCELAEAVRSPADKTQLLPVAVRDGRAVPTFTFSSAISSMANANGWIEIPDGVSELAVGAPVDVDLF